MSKKIFKIITAGEGGVGKTTLLYRYVQGKFLTNTKATLGVDFFWKEFNTKDEQIDLQLWDFGGQKSFRHILKSYVSGANGALLLFEQGLQRLFGLFSPVDTATCPFGAPRDIVVAKVGPLLIDNAFGRDFLTFIVSVLVVKVTLLTTAKISVAMGAGILPAYLPLNRDHSPAKDTIHNPCSSYLLGPGSDGNLLL